MSKRKISPLQIWRAQYAYISDQIRQLKTGAHIWGAYKQPRRQSLLVGVRHQARSLMENREVARAEAQRLYEAWAQKKFYTHNQK